MQEDRHGRGDPGSGGLDARIHRLARLLREQALLVGLDGQPGPVAGRHALVDQPDVVLRYATQDQQAVADLAHLFDQAQEGGIGPGLAGRIAIRGRGQGIQPRLGDRGVGARHARGGLDERSPVVPGRVERQRHHRAD